MKKTIFSMSIILLVLTCGIVEKTYAQNDTFDGTVVDICRWDLDAEIEHRFGVISTINGATVNQNDRLVLSVSGDFVTSIASVATQYEFTSDFDVQVDFEIGEGWSSPLSGHIDGAVMGVHVDNKVYHITRVRFPESASWPPEGKDQLWIWKDTPPHEPARINSTAITGLYRILRTNSTLYFKYDTGSGWQDLGSVYASNLPAKIYLFVSSIGASHAFTSYFDNFVVNSGLTTFSPCVIEVEIDIKPQSCPNPLNTKSKGVLPVAILGTDDFDITYVDPSTVKLEGVGPIRWNIEDVSSPVVDKQEECDCTTNGDDGFNDLTFKFDTQAIIAAIEPVNDGDEVVLTLTAELFDGTPIEGKDCIVVKSKGKGHGLGKSVAKDEVSVPEGYALSQNYPNPFNPETEIRFQLPEATHVVVRIFNILGEEVRELAGSQYEAGHHSVRWDGKDKNGNPVSSGVYIYQIKAGNFYQMKKMSILH